MQNIFYWYRKTKVISIKKLYRFSSSYSNEPMNKLLFLECVFQNHVYKSYSITIFDFIFKYLFLIKMFNINKNAMFNCKSFLFLFKHVAILASLVQTSNLFEFDEQ